MRDLSQVVLEQMLEKLKQALREIAIATHTRIDIAPVLTVEPTLASLNVQAAIEAVSQDLNLSYLYMPSRAGHDAMEMGRFTDMGMIFVPSQEGLSHSGMEYTSPEQCTQGADVLLHTLIKLDSIYA